MFLTMTYEDSNLLYADETPIIYKPHLQTFLKDLRNNQKKEYKRLNPDLNVRQIAQKVPKIRYYACGEYGDQTQRPHYHMILYNLLPSLKEKLPDIWRLGHIDIGGCNMKTIAYTTKYILKQQHEAESESQQNFKPFSLMSKGMGKGYLQNAEYHKTNKTFTVRNGNGDNQTMPRYLKDKIFTTREKEKVNDIMLEKVYKIEDEQNREIATHGDDPEKIRFLQLQNHIRKIDKDKKKNTKL